MDDGGGGNGRGCDGAVDANPRADARACRNFVSGCIRASLESLSSNS
jgi:hypothetical protein